MTLIFMNSRSYDTKGYSNRFLCLVRDSVTVYSTRGHSVQPMYIRCTTHFHPTSPPQPPVVPYHYSESNGKVLVFRYSQSIRRNYELHLNHDRPLSHALVVSIDIPVPEARG